MTTPSSSPAMNAPTPVATAAQIDLLAAHYVEVMDSLISVVQQETELVRLGRLGEAATLAAAKAELARAYITDTLRLRASQAQIARLVPEKLAEVRRRHDAFRGHLQMNLTVLATAHAVSEGIVRGVSGEMVRRMSPQTYGASGRAHAPSPRAAQPLVVSRTL